MCKQEQQLYQAQDELELPPPRSYKRAMKPRLPRKATSAARINLNRFWNELEEFYGRYNDRKVQNNNNDLFDLPDYTTDVFDHRRETAENELNERIEAQSINLYHKEQSAAESWTCCSTSLANLNLSRHRLQSQDILDQDDLESL